MNKLVVSPGSLRDGIRVFLLWMLLPGMFIYSWFVGAGWLSPYVSGYINEVSIFVVLVSIFTFILNLNSSIFVNKVDFALSIWFLWCGFIFAYHYIEGDYPSVAYSRAAFLLQAVALVVVVRAIDISRKGVQRIFRYSLAIMTALVVFFVINGNLTNLFSRDTGGQSATYQDFSRIYFIVFVISVPWLLRIRERAVWSFLGFFVLLSLGARSELVGLMLFIFLSEWLRSRYGLRALILVLLVGLTIWLLSPYIISLLPDSRIFAFLESGTDESVEMRFMQIREAVETISRNPFFGGYGSYADLGGAGNYSHNALSAWVDLGIIGFFLLIFLVIHVLFISADVIRKLKRARDSELYLLGTIVFSLGVVVVVFLLAAKSYTEVTIFFAIALAAGLQRSMLRKQSI